MHRSLRATFVCLLILPLAGTAIASASVHADAGKVKPDAGTYKGSSGVFPFRLTVARDRESISKLATAIQAADSGTCSFPGAVGVVFTDFANLAIHDGEFSARTTSSDGSAVTSVKGHFVSATKVEGTVSQTVTATSEPPCRESLPFTATHEG